jgi:hypothetical protein
MDLIQKSSRDLKKGEKIKNEKVSSFKKLDVLSRGLKASSL